MTPIIRSTRNHVAVRHHTEGEQEARQRQHQVRLDREVAEHVEHRCAAGEEPSVGVVGDEQLATTAVDDHHGALRANTARPAGLDLHRGDAYRVGANDAGGDRRQARS